MPHSGTKLVRIKYGSHIRQHELWIPLRQQRICPEISYFQCDHHEGSDGLFDVYIADIRFGHQTHFRTIYSTRCLSIKNGDKKVPEPRRNPCDQTLRVIHICIVSNAVSPAMPKHQARDFVFAKSGISREL